MNLFLDDLRDPTDCVADVYNDRGWTVVRTAREFVRAVVGRMPSTVSLDHDLCEAHYFDWTGVYHGGQPAPEEPSGMDCLRWLHGYCDETGQALPELLVHSVNPVGRAAMERYIEDIKE